ncbi:MAG: PAS domain-containing protein, partial [Sinobacteraceae bacterium]|nr:PAS domain-containing protein [Nevskiaceae bacterium]
MHPPSWRAFLQSLPSAVAMFDRDMRYLLASDRWITDYGLAGDDLIGRSHYEIFPDIPPRWKQVHARALAGEAVRCEEDRFERADGSRQWLKWEVIPWREEDGQIGGVLIYSEDISERKLIESHLAGYGELQLIADVAPVAIAYCDHEERFRFVNRRYAQRLGKQTADIVGRTIREVVGDTAYRSFASYVEQALSGEAVEFELQIPYATGARHMRCSYMPHRNSSQQVDSFVAIIEDVTDRIRARRAFEEARERLSFAVDAAEIGTFYCPMPLQTIEWNATCKAHFWLPADANIDFDLFYSRLHPDDRERIREAIARAVQQGAPYDVEYRTVSDQGHVRWIRAKGKAYYDAANMPIRFDGITIDISHQRLIAEERERLLQSEAVARAQAEAASRLKDEFLTTLSHELRTPLHAILGWTQLLAHPAQQLDPTLAEGLQVIERNGRAQARLIDDLLDMSRILSGKLVLDVQRVDLAEVIRSALQSVEPAARAKDIRVRLVLDSGPTQIRGDQSRLLQIVWNLLSNAVKFTPRGGHINVSLERVNSHIELTVTDNGIGIAPEFLPYVFERFRQADAGMGRRYGGLGLGLAIVKSIADLHGGTVRVRSAGEGLGASFSVELPLPALAEARSA